MIVRDKSSHLAISTDVNGASFHLVINSLLLDTSSGGLRIAEDLDFEEVAALAREMTLKFSFIGLQRGGAKSGLKIPRGTDAAGKRAILEEVGRRLGAIIRTGIYYPGMDMNCGPDDLRALYRGAGFNLGEMTDTSFFTAISVANAIEACVACDMPSKRPFTIAVEGFGSVAAYLAERLPADRFKFIAVSTLSGARACAEGFPADLLVSLRRQCGDEFVHQLLVGKPIDKGTLFSCDVDIAVPSARTWAIGDAVARTIKARYVIPAANAPYCENSVAILHENGVVALPGYVVNCGGVYASSLHDSGVAHDKIEQVSAGPYRRVVAALLERAQTTGVSPMMIAESVAMQRFAAKSSQVCKKHLRDKIWERAHRKFKVTRSLHANRVLSSFCANLEELEQQLRVWQL
jgi:glutamate dehydrogenase (NAD(P)+)